MRGVSFVFPLQVHEYHMQLAAAIDAPLSARDLNVQ